MIENITNTNMESSSTTAGLYSTLEIYLELANFSHLKWLANRNDKNALEDAEKYLKFYEESRESIDLKKLDRKYNQLKRDFEKLRIQ